ncbi:MAG TPA: phage tail tape measure protein, partial [Hyphomicrobiaceae bacterium]|nr:phage tail tape measure protein [Hyphomicrobiaceae bacterium]
MTLTTMVAALKLDSAQFTPALQKASSDIDAAMKQANKGLSGFNKLGRTLSDVGTSLTVGVSLPLIALGTVATKAFANFDSAMTKSTAIMGDISDAMKNDMANAARAMSETTTYSATQAADSFYFLASAGLDAKSSIEALPAVAAFATAGAFDMALATDLLTDAQSALGLTIRDDAVANMENMVRVSDTLVKANTLANASVQQFSEALTNKAGAAMRSVGMDIEEGVSVLAAFADQGVKGAEAGTQFAIVLRDLQTKALDNSKAFAEAGIAVFDANGEMRNMGSIVADVEGALTGMSDAQKKATLLMLGFSDKSVSALQTLIGTSDAIGKYETALRSAGGTTEEVAGKQMEAFSAQMSILKNRITNIAIDLGSSLAPALGKLVDAAEPVLDMLAGMVKSFTELPTWVQSSAIALTGLVVAIGPLLLMGGKTVLMVMSLKAAMAGAGVAAAGAAPLMAAIVPILTAVAVAAAAVAAVRLGQALWGWKEGSDALTGSFSDRAKQLVKLEEHYRDQGIAIDDVKAAFKRGEYEGKKWDQVLRDIGIRLGDQRREAGLTKTATDQLTDSERIQKDVAGAMAGAQNGLALALERSTKKAKEHKVVLDEFDDTYWKWDRAMAQAISDLQYATVETEAFNR